MKQHQVASLTAPITITLPKKKIEEFKKELKAIEKTLNKVVKQLSKLGVVSAKNFNAAKKHFAKQNVAQKKSVDNTRKINEEVKKTESNAKRTSKVFGDWANKLAQIRVLGGLVKFALGQVAKLVVIPTAALAGFTFLTARVNASTVEMKRLAEATGFGINEMRAMSLEARSLGFSFEHISSMAEEMNIKLGGEAGGFIENNLREGLSTLNIEAEKLQKMSIPDRMKEIMNASREMLKKGKLAELSSGFDKIFAGEGARLMTGLSQKMRESNQDWQTFIGTAQKFTTVSKGALAGADRFTEGFNKITTATKSLSMEFFGQVGNAVGPFIDSITESFKDLPRKMGPIFADVIGVVSRAMVEGFVELGHLFAWMRERPEEVKEALLGIVEVFKNMFELGVSLFKAISALMPIMSSLLKILTPIIDLISSLLENEFTRTMLAWGAAILVAVKAALLLTAGLASMTIGTIGNATAALRAAAAYKTMGASAAAANASTVLSLGAVAKGLGVVALAAGVAYGAFKTGQLIDEKLKISDIVSSDLARPEIRLENAKQDIMQKQLDSTRERRMANLSRLNAGNISNVNTSTSSNDSSTKIENNNTTNHVLVNGPEDSKRVTDAINPGRPN